jgi:hypothetical protein
MKFLLTIAAFFCFTAFVSAQEVQDRLQQQPPPVTQEQVERDAKLAAEHRKRNEEVEKAQEKALKEGKTTADNASDRNRKASRPKQ